MRMWEKEWKSKKVKTIIAELGKLALYTIIQIEQILPVF